MPLANVVIDSSAIIAFLKGEAGSDVARQYISGALVSAVNVAEVASKLAEEGMPDAETRLTVADLGMEIVPFTMDHALQVGSLRLQTRAQGLSVGDRACLVLAKHQGVPAVTADRRWAELEIGVEVRLIR